MLCFEPGTTYSIHFSRTEIRMFWLFQIQDETKSEWHNRTRLRCLTLFLSSTIVNIRYSTSPTISQLFQSFSFPQLPLSLAFFPTCHQTTSAQNKTALFDCVHTYLTSTFCFWHRQTNWLAFHDTFFTSLVLSHKHIVDELPRLVPTLHKK